MNHKIHFNRFADYANNTDIYSIVSPVDSSIVIPDQSSGHNIGTSSGNPCDVQMHNFRSTSFTKLSNGFKFNYVDSITTGGVCAGTSVTGSAKYIK